MSIAIFFGIILIVGAGFWVLTRKIRFRGIIRFFLFLPLFMLLITFFLGDHVTYFRFNINGGSHFLGISASRDEAIKRNTFITDLEIIPSKLKLGDSLFLDMHEGFIERPWTHGYWYWTTNLFETSYSYCNVIISLNSQKGEWIIERIEGQEFLGQIGNRLYGGLHVLPTDTLTYYVLKKKHWDFSNENIASKIQFVVKRK